MPDLKQYEGAITTPVTAGGAVFSTLGQGAAPAITFGSGVPTLSAPKGSLYLRTDGSTTATRAYIASDAVGTWTAITTAA